MGWQSHKQSAEGYDALRLASVVDVHKGGFAAKRDGPDSESVVIQKIMVSVDWLRTGEADERDPVDDRLDRLDRLNPEIARELRIKAGLD